MDLINDILVPQLESRPISKPIDLVKLIFQAVMGGGHMISDPEVSLKYLKHELVSCKASHDPLFEVMGERVCRYNISSVKNGLRPETLNRLFVYSANKVKGSREELVLRLEEVRAAMERGELSLPFSAEEFFAAYPEEGEIPRHSEEYREKYAPAYRVLCRESMQFYPLIERIDNFLSNGVYPVICIDGMAASGKTSLAELLSAAFDCAVFTPDDYFLTPAQRTPERLSVVGDFFDRERMYGEIISHIKDGEVTYRKYDCGTFSFGSPVTVSLEKKVVVVEGVYSAHPYMSDYFDVGVFMKTAPETQSSRILARNGEYLHRMFINEWIPRENAYFSRFGIEDRLSMKGFVFNT